MGRRILSIIEMEDIVLGSTLLGAGGGGSYEVGLNLVRNLKNDVVLEDPEEFPEKSNAVVVAAIGSPKVLLEKGIGPELNYAFDAIKNLTAVGGIKLNCVIPAELGGLNSVAPFVTASERNIPVIDADGCGRAVPELGTTLLHLNRIPASPFVVANKKNDIIVGYLSDPTNTNEAEKIARCGVVSFGMLGAISSWVVDLKTINRCLAVKTLTLSQHVGRAIREAQSAEVDPVVKAIEVTNGREIIRGTILKIEMKTTDGFDFGKMIVDGIGEYKGEQVVIDIKNENMMVWKNDEPVAMVPDLISLMTLDGQPLSNSDTALGMEIAVLGIPAPVAWKIDDEGVNCWKPILKKLGYQGDYVQL